MNKSMVKVYFEPEKRFWEVWKKSRYLTHGKDFKVTNGHFTLAKPLKGKMKVTYEYPSF